MSFDHPIVQNHKTTNNESVHSPDFTYTEMFVFKWAFKSEGIIYVSSKNILSGRTKDSEKFIKGKIPCKVNVCQ